MKKQEMISIKTRAGVIQVPANTPKEQIESIQNNFNNGATAKVMEMFKKKSNWWIQILIYQ